MLLIRTLNYIAFSSLWLFSMCVCVCVCETREISNQFFIVNIDNRYYKQQQAFLNSWNNQANSQAYNPAQGQGQGNYAYATGAYGPNGIHQTAGVNPPNKVTWAVIFDHFLTSLTQFSPNDSNFFLQICFSEQGKYWHAIRSWRQCKCTRWILRCINRILL